MGEHCFGVADICGLISCRVLALLSLILLAFAGNPSAASDKFPGRLLPWSAPLAATNLVAQPDCDPLVPSRGIATLNWTSAATKGREQRIAITIFPEGLDKGEFNFSDPLPPTATNLVWKQLRGQAIHYWRVLTLHKDGWVPSKTAKFEGPTCVSDQVQPPQKKKP
jgi:hypothetical protein